ncbi:APC family permease [Halobaculum roseum]|uniref:APC family permease n=1 Tax=Halobaculum roseum TaxID=2175149 RepID=A0ABD5ML76_9EURY|nr:APC family permease [Halobaculum roseum]QZY02393.1 APC family permease [Halobaculum roseum]
MSDDGSFGVVEGVSMALGGMIGGGIYAVLGVVTTIAGATTWAAFVLAGVVALCAAYSYTVLNAIADQNGGSVTFVQCFTGNTTLAGMTGWTLLFGYVGSMAMYAFAFGEFAVALPAVPESAFGVPLRPVVSVAAVAGFTGLILLGSRVTGQAENVLVGAKVAILVAFGVGGIAYVYLVSPDPAEYGVGGVASFGPIMAAGVSFVAFQGWQLLFYDQENMSDPVGTTRRAVLISIPAAVLVYVLVAVATYNLAPEALRSHPHTALTDAAARIAGVVGLAEVGAVIMSLSALFSTGSAINATLFSTGHFAKGLLSKDLLPDRVGDASADGVPERTLLSLGVITAALTVVGTLGAITNFASIAFIVVFAAMSALAFRHRDADAVDPVPPAVGAVGAGAFLPLMTWHLYTTRPGTFYTVVALAAFVVGVELLYFERETLAEEIEPVEEILDDVGG